MDFRLFPLVVVAIGALFLGINLGVVPASEVRAFFAMWWPMLPIVVGLTLLGGRRRGDAGRQG